MKFRKEVAEEINKIIDWKNSPFRIGQKLIGEVVDASPFLSPITEEWLSWWEISSFKYEFYFDYTDEETAKILDEIAPNWRIIEKE